MKASIAEVCLEKALVREKSLGSVYSFVIAPSVVRKDSKNFPSSMPVEKIENHCSK